MHISIFGHLLVDCSFECCFMKTISYYYIDDGYIGNSVHLFCCKVYYFHACKSSNFWQISNFFFLFLDHFRESSRTVEKIFYQKVEGGVSWLDSWDVFSCVILDLHWKVPKESEKSQVNKCYNSDVRICIINNILNKLTIPSIDYTREKNNLNSWIGSIILLRCALCFSE